MTAANSTDLDGAAVGALLAGYRRLAGLLRLVVSERDVEEVLDRVADALGELVPADDLVVWDSQGEQLLPLLVEGIDAQKLRGSQVKLGDGIAGLAALTGKPVCSNEGHLDPRACPSPGRKRAPEAIVCVPLVAREQVIGVISLYRYATDHPFSEQEVELICSFAEVAAIAIDNARAHRQLERLAATDDLTGIANRRRFREELARELAAATRRRQPLSLLLIDLDGFKQVNDHHGHEQGDHVLEAIATLLRRFVRESDLIARIGGDEFALLLPQTSKSQAQALARRLRHAVTRHAPSPGITASIGAATLEPGHNNGEELLHQADQNLYTAKQRARNRRTQHSSHRTQPKPAAAR